jgi:hypothetical protein
MKNAVFKCPMTDITNIDNSSFVKISSPMIHTMRFDLFSEIKFSVHLPNGSILEYMYPDTTYPNRPRYELQIFGTFELTPV